MRRGRARAFAAVAALAGALLLAACSREVDVTLFQDVTQSAGLAGYTGMTHGAAWGDFDGDGLPDLYFTNHLNAAQLFRNLGGGRFADVTAQWLSPEQTGGDKHGAVWADFDNDGRLDLVQLTGAVMGVGAEPKRLLRNEGGRFVDVAGPLGVVNPEGRTRMPLWLDLDADGRLDLFQGAEARLDDKTAPFVFRQGAASFTPADFALPLRLRGAPFCVVTELTADDKPELVCRLMGQGGAVQVFDLASLPARSLDLLPQTAFEDVAAADFDGDGRIDLFLARKNPPGPVALGRPSTKQVVASVHLDAGSVGQAAGFSFRAAGPLQVRVATGMGGALPPGVVRLGANGTQPAAARFEVPASVGTATPGAPGAQNAIHIGFTAPDRWHVHVTGSRAELAGGRPKAHEFQVEVTAADAIADLQVTGPTNAEEAPFRLFMNRGGSMAEESDKRGVNKRLVAGMNVVAADFDNDGDVDLFVLASGDVGLQENLLLLNDGKGAFRAVKGAGGAAGRMAGVGDSVTTADVDGDGFLDLLIAHGGSMGRSLGLPSDGGGYQLLRNVAANGNHWLMIDLEGTQSNRDGIGAVVRVTAGGVTQVRVQDGGVHHRGQNHARLHFGLGKSDKVDSVTVRWPSGHTQQLLDIAVDQRLKIKELR